MSSEHERSEPGRGGVVPTAAHTPPHNPTDDRPELPEAVEHLLDALEPDDLGELVEKLYSRTEVAEAIVTKAQAVITRLARGNDPVREDELVLLAAAMLSTDAGVQQNVTNAVRRFQRFRAHPDIPPETLARTRSWREDLLPLLGATVRVDRELRAGQPEADTLFAVPVITAVLLAGRSPEDAAGLVRSVLAAADEHVHTYLNAGRPLPGANQLVGGVIGNADFLLQVAALRTALDEHIQPDAMPDPVADPVDAVANHLKQVTTQVERAMRRPPWRAGAARDSGEPDAVYAFERIAGYLGAAADAPVSTDGAAQGGSGRSAESAAAVRTIYAELTPWVRRLRLRPPKHPQIALEARRTERLNSPVEDGTVDLEHRLAWLVAELFRGVDSADHDILVHWLLDRHPADQQDDMWLLLQRVCAAVHTMRQVPPEPAPAPGGLAPHTYRQVLNHLSHKATVTSHLPLTAAVLPCLWSRRHLVIGLLASHLAEIHFGDDATGFSQALAFTAAVVRSPVQYFSRSTATPGHPCRQRLDDESRCRHWDDNIRDPEADAAGICRDRPWSEPGLVESYRTACTVARARSPEAVRRQFERYRGPGHWIL
ncbi:MAG TPA: hypothetical protein VFX70_14030 [Mycobacteriales bacterium]|nr:hypothetical protein [Mycobacteriales bacterium]